MARVGDVAMTDPRSERRFARVPTYALSAPRLLRGAPAAACGAACAVSYPSRVVGRYISPSGAVLRSPVGAWRADA